MENTQQNVGVRRCNTPVACSKCGQLIVKGSPNFYYNPRGADKKISHYDCAKPNGWNYKSGQVETLEEMNVEASKPVVIIERFGGNCKACGKPKIATVTPVQRCRDGKTYIHTYCVDTTVAAEETNERSENVEEQHSVEESKPQMPVTVPTREMSSVASVIWNEVKPEVERLIERSNSSSAKLEGLESLVMELIESTTKQIEIKLPDLSTVKLTGIFHVKLPVLIQHMVMRRNIYLPGPSGSWKSSSIRLAAESLKLRYAYIALSIGTMPTDIFGYMIGDKLVRTIFRDFYENGGVLDIAELDNTNANVFTLLNNALDSTEASFPDGMVKRHADFIVVGNGNTPLNGPTAMYPKRVAQDAASVGRFRFIYWPYDEDAERKLCLAINPKFGPGLAVIQQLRKFAAERDQQIVIGPRESMQIATECAVGISFEDALDGNIWKCKDSIKATLMPLVIMPRQDMSEAN